jgi:hypothetical protein
MIRLKLLLSLFNTLVALSGTEKSDLPGMFMTLSVSPKSIGVYLDLLLSGINPNDARV